jgi:hypothetical protein
VALRPERGVKDAPRAGNEEAMNERYIGDEAMNLVVLAFDAAWRESAERFNNTAWEMAWDEFCYEHGLSNCYEAWKHRNWEFERQPMPKCERCGGAIVPSGECAPQSSYVCMCPCLRHGLDDGMIHLNEPCTCGAELEPLSNNPTVLVPKQDSPPEPTPPPELDPEYLDEVYDRWDSYENGRFYTKGEGMWCKVLPEYKGMKLVGLNSMPLTDGYEYQDIYEGDPEIVNDHGFGRNRLRHRRWHQKVPFGYETKATSSGEDKQLREKITKHIESQLDECDVSWWSVGWGFVLVPEPDYEKAGKMVEKALGDYGHVPWPEDE